MLIVTILLPSVLLISIADFVYAYGFLNGKALSLFE